MDLQELRTVEAGIQARAKQPIHSFDVEWSDRQPLEAVFRQRSLEDQRKLASSLASLGD